MEWSSLELKKSLVALLYYFLRNFSFFCDPKVFLEKNFSKKLQCPPELQQSCYSVVQEYFLNQNVIQGLVLQMITQFMVYEEDADLETFLEDQESKTAEIQQEIDCSLPKLSSLLVHQLFTRYP